MSVVSLRKVSIRFGKTTLLSDVSQEFEPGKSYAIVGPNGSGKSVLLKLICKFVRPTEGEVVIDPAYLSARESFPRSFGVMINGPAYLPGISGLSNLMELANINRVVDEAGVRAAMRRLELNPDSKSKVRHYSMGMKQKLGLVQAFMENQQVLVLDEPFNALDEASVINLKAILQSFRTEGKTLIFTSHDAAQVAEIADIVLRIQGQYLRVE